MRRLFTTIGAALTAIALSATIAFAGGGVSDVAKGHGEAVSEVAQAADYVSGQARGEAVSALAKQHGAAVSEAARALADASKASGQAKGAEKSAEGRLKAGGAAN